jgi:hypothetical protein
MGSDGVAWLLASTDPSVRYLTLTQVIGESRGAGRCQRLEAISCRAMLESLSGVELIHRWVYRAWLP